MPALSQSKHFQAKILLFLGEVATDKIFWYAILIKSCYQRIDLYSITSSEKGFGCLIGIVLLFVVGESMMQQKFAP